MLLIMICCDKDSFWSALVGVLCSYCILLSNSFSVLGKFSVKISLYTSFHPVSLSVPLVIHITLTSGLLIVSINVWILFLSLHFPLPDFWLCFCIIIGGVFQFWDSFFWLTDCIFEVLHGIFNLLFYIYNNSVWFAFTVAISCLTYCLNFSMHFSLFLRSFIMVFKNMYLAVLIVFLS